MSRTVSKRSRRLWGFFVIIGLAGLALLGLTALRRNNGPQGVIRRVLSRNGIDDDTIRFWTAVSSFETASWSSRVFGDSNNLFNLVVPGSRRLSYGEGQTIYPDLETAAQALVDRVMKPFRYPLRFASLSDLVHFMKSKGYFTSDLALYERGAENHYQKLYGA